MNQEKFYIKENKLQKINNKIKRMLIIKIINKILAIKS